jgi:hypothetical protein
MQRPGLRVRLAPRAEDDAHERQHAEEQNRRQQAESELAVLKDRLAEEQCKRLKAELTARKRKAEEEARQRSRRTRTDPPDRRYYAGVTMNGGQAILRD